MIPNLVQHIRSSRSTRGGSSPKWSGMTYVRPFRNWKSIFSSSTLERYHGDGSRQGLYSDIEMANPEGHTDHLGDVPKIQVKMEFLQNWDPVNK